MNNNLIQTPVNRRLVQLLQSFVHSRKALASRKLVEREWRWMSCLNDGVLFVVNQFTLLMSKATPEEENKAVSFFTQEFNDAISELLPTKLCMRIGFMSSGRQNS